MAVRAAEYVRMSTEHQKYSTENQSTAIRQYADRHGYKVVRTYTDSGKSGLRIDGRDALKKLIQDVQNHTADFEAILVYDISRWGRFQDADESAYYEYKCRREGIRIEYCAEQFENDGSPVSTIVKGVKRAMAGEYSRELSAKVFAGQCRLIELGFRQGGSPGFGLRRRLVDQNRAVKIILRRGEQKSIQTDRIVLVPGPPEEVAIVQWIYRAFAEERRTETEIASLLNGRGMKTDLGRTWTRGVVHQILINQKYIGNNVWNLRSFKLKKKRVKNTPDMWITSEGAFDPLVPRTQYDRAQAIIAERSQRLSDQEMLDILASIRQKHGFLSGLIIDEAENTPSSSSYQNRFGSLLRAYSLVGYSPERDYRYIEINRSLRQLHPKVISDAVTEIECSGGHVIKESNTDLLQINGEFTASIILARCRKTSAGSLRWHVRLDTGLQPDITIAVRMNSHNSEPLDYYLLPKIDVHDASVRLAEHNGIWLDAYRFDDLGRFFELCARENLKVAS
jgi:DNA invertase Pin-like site-specific DNA recombinase